MIRAVILQVLLLAFPIVLLAQSTDNKKSSFKEHLRTKEVKRKNAVKEHAMKNRIPITGTGADGAYMYLHHIDDNKPIYYTTRGRDNNPSAELPPTYIRMDQKDWKPLDDNIKLEKANSTYLSIKSSEIIEAVYIIKSDGKTVYKSKRLGTKMVSIATKKMERDRYVLCIKTANALSSKIVIIK